MNKTIEFIQLGSEVSRYHTLVTLTTETVGHHSHGVAMLCSVFDPTARLEVIQAALRHDLSEHVTGDIPSPAKRVYGIGEEITRLEKQLLCEAALPMPELTVAEIRTLKLADIAQGALFCARELSLGNSPMLRVLDRYLSYAESLVLTEHERNVFTTIEGFAK